MVNRKAHEARVYAEKIEAPLNAPTERLDEPALVEELAQASRYNSELAQRAENRKQLAVQAAQHGQTAGDFEQQAQRLEAQALTLREQAMTLREQSVASHEKAGDIAQRLATAEPLPDHKDVSEIQARIADARTHNAQVELMQKRHGLLAEADDYDRQSEMFTDAINQRQSDKQAKIAAAAMPVAGLGFGQGIITLNGLPFDQASDAEQLRVSVGIAMASNPQLRVIRVRDGSLLDEDALRQLTEMAVAQDYQVWIERVDSSGTVGFVLEDGHVKIAAVATPQEGSHA